MKSTCILLAAALAGSVSSLTAQEVVLPGAPEASGVTPKGVTIYINVPDEINNASTESLGVGIASNGNVVVGWEDNGDGITDLAAVWTLFDAAGTQLTPSTEITSAALGGSINSKFLSYFRADGTPTPGGTSWGPKIKANPFGAGFGMGATSFALGMEVPELAAIENDAGGENAGDYPSVQLLSNDGEPVRIVTGVTDAYAEREGDIRIGDWDFLANGNIVVVGESRQGDDLVNVYSGASPGNHAIYRVVDSSGNEVKAVSLVSEVPEVTEMWHGAAVTENGFAIRFALAGRGTIRLFDNAGNATSTNIDLGDITGTEPLSTGGRGDGIGFHGNGKDAYVIASKGTGDDGTLHVWVAVLNADGTLRWVKPVTTDVLAVNPDRVDAAIDDRGRVLVVFDDQVPIDDGSGNPPLRSVMGRLFDPAGNPLGGTFYVSENEVPGTTFADSRRPRAALRSDLAAVVWESGNSGILSENVVALRLFSLFTPGTIESAGLTRIVPDTIVGNPQADALGNWEPYASVLGTSHFLVEGNTFAQDSAENQRYVIAIQPVAGGAHRLVEGFYADDGTPFTGQINLSRQNGNPGRVAGDTRPGAVNYMVGGEASPHALPEFQSGDRWNTGYDRLGDGRYGTVQIFALAPADMTPSPLSDALDSANGRLAEGGATDSQITRFGGDIVALDNGNFVSVVEDRSRVRFEEGNAAVATIFAPDGSIVKETFLVASGDIWSNVAAYKGGFAVRVLGVIYFYDNAGNLLGQVNQDISGESFDAGRGDGTRIAGHINSPYIFLAGKVTTGALVKVAAFDSRDRTASGVMIASEPAFAGNFDRVNLAVDALSRITVGWVAQPAGYGQQQVAARVLGYDSAAESFSALTPSFLPFVNTSPTNDIRTIQMSLAMTTRQILIAAKGEINTSNQPGEGVTSPREVNFYTVITHPNPQNDPTTPVGGGGGQPTLVISRTTGDVTITWEGTGFKLQRSNTLPAAWTDVSTTGNSFTTQTSDPAAFYRLTNQ